MKPLQHVTYFKKHRTKFNNKRIKLDGMNFQSQSEGTYYSLLKQQVQEGLIKSFETQVKEELYAYGVKICNYFVDFLIYHNDDSKEYVEHKSQGTVTDTWRMKYKMLEAKYKNDPNIKVSINWYKGYKVIQKKK